MNPKRHPVLPVVLTLLTTAFILPVLPASAAVTYLGTLAGPSIACDVSAPASSTTTSTTASSSPIPACDQIQFYSLTGTKLGEFGTHGTGNGQFDSPRDARSTRRATSTSPTPGTTASRRSRRPARSCGREGGRSRVRDTA